MNILISNDDGIHAEGIKRLAAEMAKYGDVFVVAPSGQRSAGSHSLSIGKDIVVTEIPFAPAKKAYQVSGTPADCVKMGIDVLKRQGTEIDVVYSGINHGGNLGSDTMYSGTVSAAAEGAFLGLPAVAVSVNSHEPKHFDAACTLAAKVLNRLPEIAGSKSVVSINTPDLPLTEIKGLRPAELGNVEYDEWFYIKEERKDGVVYRYSGVPIEVAGWTDDMDTKLIRQGFATISMVKYDLNDFDGLKKIKKWGIEL